jgi:toluene monooxygenase system ferredoxin subunit
MAWKTLCKLDEIEPATMKSVTVDGTEFLVLRGEEDDILVIPPSCPHMQTPLCDGFFDGCLLTCSQHLWQWSVKDGSMQGIAEAPLAVYPSRREGGELRIDFQRELRYQHEVEG